MRTAPNMDKALTKTKRLFDMMALPLPPGREHIQIKIMARLCREAVQLLPKIESSVPLEAIVQLRNALAYIEPKVAKLTEQANRITR